MFYSIRWSDNVGVCPDLHEGLDVILSEPLQHPPHVSQHGLPRLWPNTIFENVSGKIILLKAAFQRIHELQRIKVSLSDLIDVNTTRRSPRQGFMWSAGADLFTGTPQIHQQILKRDFGM